MSIKSQQELYEEFKTEVESQSNELTDFNEGSNLDVIAGATTQAVSEVTTVAVDRFAKTFFSTANGPEVTGGPDELEFLAIDHYGPTFARRGAVRATGEVTFSRPNNDAGTIEIPAGTIVKTPPNAAGQSQSFEVLASVSIVATSINASVRALTAGVGGNVQAGRITLIESSLLDPTITVDNAAAFVSGSNQQSDAEYRESIANRILSIQGSIDEAIEAAALTVAGVLKAKSLEIEMPVIEYDIGADDIKVGAEFFRIPFSSLYIADANGTASAPLIASVQEEINKIKSFGVFIRVRAAVAVQLDWTATISLNLSGPNYTELSSDTTKITDAMAEYVNNLEIGQEFNIVEAEAFINSVYGPGGTGDLASFTTSVPTANALVEANEKIIANDMVIS